MVQIAPTDAELERAIASVPGVVSAAIDRSGANGRSRMRLRLPPGEDEEAVVWAVAATLRERFGIAIDPDAIRPRPVTATDPADDPVQLVSASDAHAGSDEVDNSAAHAGSGREVPEAGDPRSRSAGDLTDTRERLRLAAAGAIEVLAGLTDLTELADVAGIIGLAELADADADAGSGEGPVDMAPIHLVASEIAAPDQDGRIDPGRRTVVPRAVIGDLQIRRDEHSVQVNVVLRQGERSEEGRAVSVPTSHGALRAVAEATVAALRSLTEGSLLVGIDRVSVRHTDDAPIATVLLSLLTRRGEERLLGASIVHDGPERAVLRATLDALNRRMTPLIGYEARPHARD